jgi:4-amino-4-deoxy-L-arabinose transferase-like glycosyltransferase
VPPGQDGLGAVTVGTRARAHLAIVVVVASLTCLAGLGGPAITDSDEAFYAEAAREMVESGDWLTPRYNYANRFQKPVLFYWLVAATYEVTGPTEWAARFPAALSGIGLAVLTWACARRWFDDDSGLVAGVVLGTSLGAVAIARLSLPDLPLALFISLAIALGIEAFLVPDRPRRSVAALAGAAAGAAFLTKGPVGIVIPTLVVGGLVIVERRWRALAHAPLFVAVAACAAIGAPWYVAMTREHGTAYLQSFFIGDNLERFATERFNEPRPLWFYLPIVMGGMLPWSPYFALWVADAVTAVRRRLVPSAVVIRIALWAALPLLLFTASIGKQPRYILPMLPPLAIGVAAALRARRAASADDAPGLLLRVSALATGVAVAVLGAVLAALPPDAIGASRLWLTGGGLATALAGTLAAMAGWRRPQQSWPLTAGAAIVLLLSAQFGLFSTAGDDSVKQVAARIRALPPATAWTAHDVLVRNLVFYVGRREAGPFDDAGLVRFLGSEDAAVAVLKAQDVARIEASSSVPLYRLGEWQYFNVAGIRASLLIDRNPARRIRTVVLVSNRPPGARSAPGAEDPR